MKKAILFSALAAMLVVTSCKEDKIRYHLAGVWEIEEAHMTYYSNGSIIKDTIANDFGFFTLQDNEIDGQNECHYSFKTDGVIRSIRQVANTDTQLNTQEDYCWWGSDWYDEKRLNLIEQGEYYNYFLTYTLEKINKNKYQWVYVERGVDSLNLGSMSYKEVLTVKRVK
jgi:hypothetical protein